jgi:hypothetical protein
LIDRGCAAPSAEGLVNLCGGQPDSALGLPCEFFNNQKSKNQTLEIKIKQSKRR